MVVFCTFQAICQNLESSGNGKPTFFPEKSVTCRLDSGEGSTDLGVQNKQKETEMNPIRDLRLCMASPENPNSQETPRCFCQGLLYIYPSDFSVQQSKKPQHLPFLATSWHIPACQGFI